MRNLLIQALRKWGSDSVVVTWTWIAEESLEADSIWPARSLHTCFTHADQTDPVCAELTGSKTKTLLVGNSFNGLASLNLLFDHCGLKTLNTPGALSVLSVMEKYMIFLFFYWCEEKHKLIFQDGICLRCGDHLRTVPLTISVNTIYNPATLKWMSTSSTKARWPLLKRD